MLSFDHVAVEAVVGHEFCVRAELDDSAMIEHDDDVGVGDGAEPMGDDERRAGGEQIDQ